MLTKTEIRIMGMFAANNFLQISMNGISRELKIHYRVARVNALSLMQRTS